MGFQCLPNVVSKQSISLSLSAALKRHGLKSFLTCSRSPKESIGGVQTRNGGRVHRKAALRTTMWMHAGTNRHDAGSLQSGSRLQGAPRLWGEPFGRFQPRCCAPWLGATRSWKMRVPYPIEKQWAGDGFCQASCVDPLSSLDGGASAANGHKATQMD